MADLELFELSLLGGAAEVHVGGHLQRDVSLGPHGFDSLLPVAARVAANQRGFRVPGG